MKKLKIAFFEREREREREIKDIGCRVTDHVVTDHVVTDRPCSDQPTDHMEDVGCLKKFGVVGVGWSVASVAPVASVTLILAELATPVNCDNFGRE